MRALSLPARWSPFFVLFIFAASLTALEAQEQAEEALEAQEQAEEQAEEQVEEQAEEFRIGTGDVLRIAVWKEPELSSTVTRAAGRRHLDAGGRRFQGRRTDARETYRPNSQQRWASSSLLPRSR